jgi:hypothetical protein
MLVRRVHEVGPLECAKCSGAMKILSFIEHRQQDAIERILRHCGLWEGPVRTLASARAPPARSQPDPQQPRELRLVLDPEFLQSEFEDAQAEASREYQLLLDPEFLWVRSLFGSPARCRYGRGMRNWKPAKPQETAEVGAASRTDSQINAKSGIFTLGQPRPPIEGPNRAEKPPEKGLRKPPEKYYERPSSIATRRPDD